MTKDDQRETEGERPTSGPEPERLKIERGDWKEAIKRAVQKQKPPEGWPDEGVDESAKEDEGK